MLYYVHSKKKGSKTKMKIILILYIIGIITYWLGVFNLAFTAKRNWNDVDESLKANAKSGRMPLVI